MRPFLTRTTILLNDVRQSIINGAIDGGTKLETGGALFGFDDDSHIVITASSGPGPNAVREQRYFLRDLVHTQAFAETIFSESGAQWIGEWHTHPHGPTEPSERDLRTYAEHLFDMELDLDAFVSVIVIPAKMHHDVAVHLWCLERFESNILIHRVDPQIGEMHDGRTV